MPTATIISRSIAAKFPYWSSFGHRPPRRNRRYAKPTTRLLDPPEEKGRREQHAPRPRAGRDRERDAAAHVAGGAGRRDADGRRAARSTAHHAIAMTGTIQRSSSAASRRSLVAETPHAAQQEDDVGEERDVQQEDELRRVSAARERSSLETSPEEKGPGRDPVEEGAAADLLVEQKKQQKQQDRPCRLDEQGKLIDRHQDVRVSLCAKNAYSLTGDRRKR